MKFKIKIQKYNSKQIIKLNNNKIMKKKMLKLMLQQKIYKFRKS